MQAIATGIAIIMNVHDIQAVLWIVRNLVSGLRYIGMGTAIETMAMRHTVRGNPND